MKLVTNFGLEINAPIQSINQLCTYYVIDKQIKNYQQYPTE